MQSSTCTLFNGNHLKYLANFTKRVKGSCMEVIGVDATRYLITYLHETRTWKVEHVDTHGFLYMDFRKHLRKFLDGIEDIGYIKLMGYNEHTADTDISGCLE